MQPPQTTLKERFEANFPPVLDYLPIEYKFYLEEKGRTGIEFDIENDRREKAAFSRNEEILSFIQSEVDKARVECAEIAESYVLPGKEGFTIIDHANRMLEKVAEDIRFLTNPK